MVIWQLFLSFMKIGFTSFGGMSMVPLILEEMESHRWMNAEDLSNLIAIAEMTPGPLGINCATFAGLQTAKTAGALAAVTGVLMPAYTLTLAAAVCFDRFHGNEILADILAVIKPICIALILGVIISLGLENYFPENQVDAGALLIGAAMLYLIEIKKWKVPQVIGTAALMGIILYGFS
ncbi:MAG: chromate transporter [Lachnospiraceae bacterium]|nr:chromate transporter [Lachnospiraceae bacterium]